jgi:lysophospholipase L1-like esterase
VAVDAPQRPAARPEAPRISPAKQLVFALVMVLLVLAAIEGSVRAYHAVRNVGSGDPEPRGYVVEDAQAGYALKPGYAAGGIRINSLGFRGPEITCDKPPGVQRIVALGDSATFGPSEQECAYPFLLGDLLAPRSSQTQTQVVNAGVEGYRSDRALVHLRRDVLPLQPDVVTVFIGWNDLYQTDPSVEADQLSLRASPLTRLLLLSDAAQTFRRLYFLRFETQRADTQGSAYSALLASYRPDGYAERLREIIRAARAAGA